MASLADFHPAFEVPPGSTECCHCFGLPTNTCPDFVFQGKQCTGTPDGIGPCGFYNAEDDTYYATKHTTNAREVRTVDPPPHAYACETIDDGDTYRTTVGTVDEVINYNSLVVDTCTVNPTTLECECEQDVTPSSYALTRQLVRIYFNPSCTGEFIEAPGAYITELDPENSVFDEVSFIDAWEQPNSADLQSSAEDNAAENCSEEWGDTPIALKSFALGEDDEVVACLTVTCQTRIRITGGNSGYIRIVYGVMDENGVIPSTHEVEYEWDPTTGGADVELPGPELTVPWPSGTGDDTFRLREMILIETSCIPEEE